VGQDTRIQLWPKDISMGHHAGISFEGWVNITGMVGQHKTEWWVNMLRNLQPNNKADLKIILEHWATDPKLNWQRLNCREFIKLEKIADNYGDHIQFSKEFRVFLWKNQVVGF
jgi:hypothetical protein